VNQKVYIFFQFLQFTLNLNKFEFPDKNVRVSASAFMVDLTWDSKAVYQGQRRTIRVKW
jgi:hypothetical protein